MSKIKWRVCVLHSHHSGSLHGVANHHDDPALVGLQDPGRRTLHNLTVWAECWAEGDVDAASDVTSAETGVGKVKECSF